MVGRCTSTLEVRADWHIFFAHDQKWHLSHEESMRAGEASDWLRVDDVALTPDQVTGAWEVSDNNRNLVNAPGVKARVMSKEEEEEERHCTMSCKAGNGCWCCFLLFALHAKWRVGNWGTGNGKWTVES